MSYLKDRRNRNKKIRKIIVILIIFSFLFYFRGPIWSGVSFVGNVITRPVLKLFSNIGDNFEYFALRFEDKKDLHEENKELKEKIAKIEIKMIEHDYLLQENESLKETLNRLPENKEFILASVLMRPKLVLFDDLIIDAGAKEGIEEGKLVFAYGNVPVGRVDEVYPKSAKVKLFSNSGTITDVYVSTDNIAIELIGRGGGNFKIILPKDLMLKKGDLALLPGLSNYPIAKVETIANDPRDPYSKALLSSLINIQELKFVEVEK
jgi:rod shape-determining protein MreC